MKITRIIENGKAHRGEHPLLKGTDFLSLKILVKKCFLVCIGMLMLGMLMLGGL